MRINRLIFWLALAGMVLAVHLWIQKARGFDQGCFGLAKPAEAVAGGCRQVDDLPGSHLLGVSNAAWGFAFYFGVALLSLVKLVVAPGLARRAHALSEALVCGGALYSAYLLVVMMRGGALCALCVGSALLVFALFSLHAGLRARGGFAPVAESGRVVEFGFAGLGLFAAGGALLGVLLFVNRLGTRPLGEGSGGRELENAVGTVLELQFDYQKLTDLRACRFEGQAPALDLARFIGPTTPFIGKPDGVPVILFSEPTCEACRLYHPEFMRAAERMGDRARFTILPRVFREESVLEASALKVAETSGKYFELWRALFALQPRAERGLTLAQIAELFREVGIDATDLERRLAAARPAVLALRQAAKAGDVDLVPVVYIGGRKVWIHNRGERCLGRLIERAAVAESAPPERRRVR